MRQEQWRPASWTTVLGPEHEFTCWDMVTFCNLEMLMSPVQPLPEILCDIKEEAMVAENERGHQGDTTMGWKKGFLFNIINRNFIWRKVFLVSLFSNHL